MVTSLNVDEAMTDTVVRKIREVDFESL